MWNCSATSSRICTRSEEHTSELQSRLVISYAVFCLKKKKFNYGVNAERLKTWCFHSLSEILDHLIDILFLFFFNDPATTEIYTTRHTLSLHDALPISFGLAPLLLAVGCGSNS